MAKHNAVYNYAVVGITEALEEFIEALEKIMPQFFEGATEVYKERST